MEQHNRTTQSFEQRNQQAKTVSKRNTKIRALHYKAKLSKATHKETSVYQKILPLNQRKVDNAIEVTMSRRMKLFSTVISQSRQFISTNTRTIRTTIVPLGCEMKASKLNPRGFLVLMQ